MLEINRYIKDAHSTSKKDSVSLELAGKIILTLLAIWMGLILIFKDPPWIFLDNVNLIIHEAGHFVFSGFGELFQYLGGTILQLLIPFLFAVYFLIKRNLFAFSFILFWIGDNFVNIAFYIKDAQARQLHLVGGGDHDWFYILSRLGVLEQSVGIGRIVNTLGILIIFIGLFFMIISLIHRIFSNPSSEIGISS